MSGREEYRRVTATDARVRFGELMEEVHDGEVVVVEKAGREMIALIPAERLSELRPIRLHDEWWNKRSNAFTELKANAGDDQIPSIRELIDAGRS